MHFIEKYGMMALRIPSKFDMRRFCRATGATAMTKLQAPGPAELGYVKHMVVEEIGNVNCVVLQQVRRRRRGGGGGGVGVGAPGGGGGVASQFSELLYFFRHAQKRYRPPIPPHTHAQDAALGSVATVVLRGSTEGFLDDVERAVDDGVNAYKVGWVGWGRGWLVGRGIEGLDWVLWVPCGWRRVVQHGVRTLLPAHWPPT